MNILIATQIAYLPLTRPP